MKERCKYRPLLDYLRHCEQDEVTLSFAEIEALLGASLPSSARRDRGWWSNRRRGGLQAAAWLETGYRAEDLDLKGERITFRKPVPVTYQVRRVNGEVIWDGESIKALRLHMGVSQVQLAQEMGVRPQTICEWETGRYEPSRAMSKYLSRVAKRAQFESETEE